MAAENGMTGDQMKALFNRSSVRQPDACTDKANKKELASQAVRLLTRIQDKNEIAPRTGSDEQLGGNSQMSIIDVIEAGQRGGGGASLANRSARLELPANRENNREIRQFEATSPRRDLDLVIAIGAIDDV